MEQHNLTRAADIIIEEFGDNSQQKINEMVEQLMENNCYETARKWVQIGYIVKDKLEKIRQEQDTADIT